MHSTYLYEILTLVVGWGAHYASWRWTQICLGIAGLLTFVLLAIFLPETSHPGSRGIDKYRRAKGYDSSSEVFKWVWLNPFKCFRLLKSPNLLLTVCYRNFVKSELGG